MEQWIDKLHDIEGLRSVSQWPLAMGWKLVLILFAIFIIGLSLYLFQRARFAKSWKNDAFCQLKKLEENLSESSPKESAILLSQFMRRVAMYRFSRKECAGLIGKEWLRWLKCHDPKNFNWEERGKVLIDAPYSQKGCSASSEQMKLLFKAARRWVR